MKKILYFIFVLFFSRSSSPSPSWVKKKLILRGSGAFRLGNLVPRDKARRWLNLLHWWNGKRQQIKNIDRFLIGITLASQKRQLIRHVTGWSYRSDETSLPKIRFSSLFARETNVFAGYDETVEDNKIIRVLFVFKRPVGWIEPAFYVDPLNTGCPPNTGFDR